MTREKIKQVMDMEYERMYPFELERQSLNWLKKVKMNNLNKKFF